MHKIGEMSFVGDENPYITAFLSLKYDLLVVEELNAIVPEAVKRLASEKDALLNVMDAFIQRLKKGDIAENEVNEFLGKLTEQVEIQKRFTQIAMQAKTEVDRKGIKQAFLGVDQETAIGKALLDGLRAYIFPRYFITFIRNMSLVYLVALFENYLSKVLQITMQNEPRILMTSQKSITVEDLLKLDNIEDVRKQVIDKEIADIVNEDLDKLAKYFEEKFKLKLAEVSDWSQFKERFYRRNIIVHNSGYTNKLYRQKTGYKGKNKKMDVSERYLQYSINLFGKWAMGISMFLTQKFLRSDSQGEHHTAP